MFNPYCSTVASNVFVFNKSIAPCKSLTNFVIDIIIVAALNARTKVPTSVAKAPINPICWETKRPKLRKAGIITVRSKFPKLLSMSTKGLSSGMVLLTAPLSPSVPTNLTNSSNLGKKLLRELFIPSNQS